MYEMITVLADVGLTAQSMLTKVYQKKAGDSYESGMLFNILLGIFTMAIFFVGNGFRLTFTWYSLWMATLICLCSAIYAVIGFKIMNMGYVAQYSLFLMLGVMVLPFVYGVLFLREPSSWLRWVALAVLVVSIALSGSNEKQEHKKGDYTYLILCMAVFMLNGLLGIFSKQHQISPRATCDDNSFVFWVSAVKAVFGAVMYGCLRLRRRGKEVKDEKQMLALDKKKLVSLMLICFVTSAISGVAYLLQLIVNSHLEASVMYPILTGGTIVITAVAGRIFFKEKLSKKAWIGIALCFLATLMFL